MEDYDGKYYGTTHITVHFNNRAQWQKWRKYVLKTDWEFDGGAGPYTAALDEHFENTDDVERIVKEIVQLLQMGFDVYSADWKLQEPDMMECGHWTDDGQYVVEKIPVTMKEEGERIK